MLSGMDVDAVTVGQLRAELVGWPDETPVVVLLPDRHDPLNCAVREVSSAGVHDLNSPAAVLACAFPLEVNLQPTY
ncbi:MAG: hypothetical protein HGA44_08870 [Cellulomonadaceae bacterium]|nr:hypothetical protein [Cellulomonadaceae bacterium]